MCIVYATVYSTATLFFMIDPCFSNEYRFSAANRVLTTVTYCILGISFFIAGVAMNLSLKRYFQHFYEMFSCFLWIACICLTVPLFLRAGINGLRTQPKFEAWWSNYENFAATNTLFLVFTTYIPILTQMSSLVFGYLRKK